MLSKMGLFSKTDVEIPKLKEILVSKPIHVNPIEKNTSYQCDGRKHCSQMTSYEEAVYFNKHCPDTKMDGDHDGTPCEKQFNKW
jgi:hypothetical protein